MSDSVSHLSIHLAYDLLDKELVGVSLCSGMTDITSDADFTHAYDKLPVEQPGDAEMAEERRFFMSHVDDIVLQLTLFQNTVTYFRDMFVVDADFLVTSNVKLLDEGIDHTGYERLKVDYVLLSNIDCIFYFNACRFAFTINVNCCVWIGELLIRFQDAAFLPFRASFSAIYKKLW